eukprot:TRINITY_DN8112_c1_g1_i1.p1 TRINITY_DN8112_c1_g1~~TRINITY_DN8112_c1_g1_i1.p1  ORF type:complete len:190 (-),score=0.02 TRINITY_DN8112_c1_g1_i1:141-710(-)
MKESIIDLLHTRWIIFCFLVIAFLFTAFAAATCCCCYFFLLLLCIACLFAFFSLSCLTSLLQVSTVFTRFLNVQTTIRKQQANESICAYVFFGFFVLVQFFFSCSTYLIVTCSCLFVQAASRINLILEQKNLKLQHEMNQLPWIDFRHLLCDACLIFGCFVFELAIILNVRHCYCVCSCVLLCYCMCLM